MYMRFEVKTHRRYFLLNLNVLKITCDTKERKNLNFFNFVTMLIPVVIKVYKIL